MKSTLQLLLLPLLEKHTRRHNKARHRWRRRRSKSSLHDLRLAARRLQAVLQLSSVLDPGDLLRRSQHALKKELSASGALRDLHVQLRLLNEVPTTRPKKIRHRLQNEARKATRTCLRKLKHAKPKKHLAALMRVLQERHETAASEELARQRLLRMLTANSIRVGKLLRRARTDPHWLHRARVALKKFRYLGEALHPLPPFSNASRLERLRSCQVLMGDIHDLGLMLLRLRGETSGASARAFIRRRRAALLRSFRTAAGKCFTDWPSFNQRVSVSRLYDR